MYRRLTGQMGIEDFVLPFENFTYVDWVYAQGKDIFQQQIGFDFFRNDVWRFPLGSSLNYNRPVDYYQHSPVGEITS